MFIAITLSILLLTTIVLIILRFSRPDFSFAWPVAAFSAVLAWISTFLWQINLPGELSLLRSGGLAGIDVTISLHADGINFPYAIGMTTVLLATMFVSAMKAKETPALNWAWLFFYVILGVLAVTASNTFTLVIALALLDITRILIGLHSSQEAQLVKRAVLSYGMSVIGIGIILWAGIIYANDGVSFDIVTDPHKFSTIFLIGVILRLAAITVHSPILDKDLTKTELDDIFPLISMAATVSVLARIHVEITNPVISAFLILFIALAGLMITTSWLRSSVGFNNPVLWTLGVASLALVASVQGNPIGSVAWGSAGLFLGGILNLYSVRNKWLTIVLLAAVYSLSALPFSLTATGWTGSLTSHWVPIILLIPLQALLVSGFILSLVRKSLLQLDEQPRWVKTFYPIGLISLVLTSLMLGFFGWVGAGHIGAWIPAVIAVALLLVLTIILSRTSPAEPIEPSTGLRPVAWIEDIAVFFAGLFHSGRRLLDILSWTFEGDGGFLWTILLLIIFVTALQVIF